MYIYLLALGLFCFVLLLFAVFIYMYMYVFLFFATSTSSLVNEDLYRTKMISDYSLRCAVSLLDYSQQPMIALRYASLVASTVRWSRCYAETLNPLLIGPIIQGSMAASTNRNVAEDIQYTVLLPLRLLTHAIPTALVSQYGAYLNNLRRNFIHTLLRKFAGHSVDCRKAVCNCFLS